MDKMQNKAEAQPAGSGAWASPGLAIISGVTKHWLLISLSKSFILVI